MKTNKPITLLVSLTALGLVAGCGREYESGPASEAARPASNRVDNVEQATRDAPRAVQEQANPGTQATTQRAEFLTQFRRDLTELSKEIDLLAQKTAGSSDAIKAESEAKLNELRAKVTRLGEQLDHVPGAAESNWLEVKESLSKAYLEAKESLNQARDWLAEKIKP